MKNGKAELAHEGIIKIKRLLTEAKEILDSFPACIQESILNHHTETSTMQHCLCWGLQAVKEIHEDWYTIIENNKLEFDREWSKKEKIVVQISNDLLHDKLRILAIEYSVSDEFLINTALQRLIADVEFIRNLRNGNVKIK